MTKTYLQQVVAVAADLLVERHGRKAVPLVRENWAQNIKSIFPKLAVESVKAKLTSRIRNMHRPKKEKTAEKDMDTYANMNDSGDIESFLEKHVVQGNTT